MSFQIFDCLTTGNVYSNNERLIQENNEEGVYANAETHSDRKNNIGKMYIPKKVNNSQIIVK